MTRRINYAVSGVYDAMDAVDKYLEGASLDAALLHLVRLRASQLNGCAYCIDMHWKDLRALGDDEQRLYSLDAWRECPYYSERERAALEWTEAITRISDTHASDAVYESVRRHFSERELADLTLAVAQINSWNRLSIAARPVPGLYRPAVTAA
ncbi:MAG: carboxymuconolactone decarboxylase family protein [Gemmatimonadota bacterium]